MFAFNTAVIKSVTADLKAAAKAEGTVATRRNAAGQKMVDAIFAAWALSDQSDKAKFWKAAGCLKACSDLFADCDLSESAVRNYPKSVRLAFIHGVPFTASLFTPAGQKAAGIGRAVEAAEAGAKPAKAGAVKSTTRADLDATLNKALQQMRLLKLDGLAADALDLFRDRLEGFEEKADPVAPF